MRLSHYEIETVFELSPEVVNVLIVEEPSAFLKYCYQLLAFERDEDSQFYLSEKDTQERFSKHCLLVSDLLRFCVESKKVTTKLMSDLKEIVESEYYTEFHQISESIYKLFDKLNAESRYPIQYDDMTDITSIFKAFSVKLSENESDFLENLVSFIRVNNYFLGIKNFFFVNLKCYLTMEQLDLLYKEVELENVSLFLLENTQREKHEKEKTLIIDKDWCEIIV